MNWMKSKKGFWTCFAGIAFATIVLFLMSSCDVPVPTNSPAPTDTPVPTATIASIPTNTAVPVTTVTSVLIDTPVPVTTVTSAPTETSPTTSPLTAADIPTRSYPTPSLVDPAPGATIMGEKLTNFSWQWDDALQEGEKFDLRIWRPEKPCRTVAMPYKCNFRLYTPPDGFGQYQWQVAIVWIDESGNKSTLCESLTWPFVWSDVSDAIVNTDALNLRSGPGVVYDVLGALKQGDCLKINCKCPEGKWLEVTCPSSGQEGWVNASFLEINVPLAGVSTAQAPPTPTPMHTPTPTETPTPELLPPPIPLEPENGACFLGEPVTFRWQWNRPRASDEVFSVRVRREGETRLCHHDKADKPEYKGSLSYCTAGTHYWSVALVRDLRPWLPEEDINRWQDLSEPSDKYEELERWFYYVPGEEPWVRVTQEPGEERGREERGREERDEEGRGRD